MSLMAFEVSGGTSPGELPDENGTSFLGQLGIRHYLGGQWPDVLYKLKFMKRDTSNAYEVFVKCPYSVFPTPDGNSCCTEIKRVLEHVYGGNGLLDGIESRGRELSAGNGDAFFGYAFWFESNDPDRHEQVRFAAKAISDYFEDRQGIWRAGMLKARAMSREQYKSQGFISRALTGPTSFSRQSLVFDVEPELVESFAERPTA